MPRRRSDASAHLVVGLPAVGIALRPGNAAVTGAAATIWAKTTSVSASSSGVGEGTSLEALWNRSALIGIRSVLAGVTTWIRSEALVSSSAKIEICTTRASV